MARELEPNHPANIEAGTATEQPVATPHTTLNTTTLRIGTRSSTLARAQTQLLVDALAKHCPELRCELITIGTHGDRDQTTPLTHLRAHGVFTGTLEEALLAGSIDVAVHSMKDMTFPMRRGLSIGAALGREDPRDVLIHRDGKRWHELDASDVLGTCSLRRERQTHRQHTRVRTVPVRGNVDVRLEKLFSKPVNSSVSNSVGRLASNFNFAAENNGMTGLILAAAGVHRLGLQQHITDYLPLETFIPAPCQGIIALQSRADDVAVNRILSLVNHPTTWRVAQIESRFSELVSELHTTRESGSLSDAPVGCVAEVKGNAVFVRGYVDYTHDVTSDLTDNSSANNGFNNSQETTINTAKAASESAIVYGHVQGHIEDTERLAEKLYYQFRHRRAEELASLHFLPSL